MALVDHECLKMCQNAKTCAIWSIWSNLDSMFNIFSSKNIVRPSNTYSTVVRNSLNAHSYSLSYEKIENCHQKTNSHCAFYMFISSLYQFNQKPCSLLMPSSLVGWKWFGILKCFIIDLNQLKFQSYNYECIKNIGFSMVKYCQQKALHCSKKDSRQNRCLHPEPTVLHRGIILRRVIKINMKIRL